MDCCESSKTAPEDDEEDMDGPLDDRSCTDIIFLALFAAFLVGMFILFGMGVNTGDPNRLLAGTDVAGNVCGRSNSPITNVSNSGLSMQGKKYLYFDWVRTAKILGQSSLNSVLTNTIGNFSTQFNGLNFDSNTMVPRDFCISEAYQTPAKLTKESRVYKIDEEEFKYFKDSSIQSEVGGIIISKKLLQNDTTVVALLQNDGSIKVWKTSKVTGSDSASELLSNDPISSTLSGGKVCRYCVEACPSDYEPLPLLHRCVPKQLTSGTSSLFSGSGIENFGEELAKDFQVAKNELAQMGITALGLSVLITIAFRFLAGLIVYIIIALVVLAVVLGTIALWVIWWLKKGDLAEQQAALDSLNTVDGTAAVQNVTQSIFSGVSAAESQHEVNGYLAAAIFATIITVVILLVLFILRKRIGLVVALFHEAGKAVHAMPYLVFIPLLTFLALTITTVVWLYASLWIFTADHPEVDSSTTYVKYVPDTFMFWMRWYHILGGLWITQFCIACQHLVIAGSVAGWYFTKDKGSVGVQTVISAFWRLVRYHLGTAAFGSFIIALIQLIRIILTYVQHLVKKYEKKGCTGSKAIVAVLKCVLWCLQGCMYCFERFMKFININAYIETAIYGYNFCRAAMKAFQLLMANALRVAAINSIGTFVLFLGKMVVVIATGVISYYILKDNREVQYFWPQIVVSVLFSYLIAHTFIGVYEMAIDTIFLCFCEDSSRNDGINKPYYMSRDLMQFVENSKKALDALDHKNDMKKNESKAMLVQERRYSDDSIAMIDVD